MQLALTPEVLFPLVAGAAVAIAVIAVIIVLGRGRHSEADDVSDDPQAADWTGEAANGDPASVVAPRVAVVGPHRPTVAEAVAARVADTAPLPVCSSTYVGSVPGTSEPAARSLTTVPEAAPSEASPAGPTPLDRGPAGPTSLDRGPAGPTPLDRGPAGAVIAGPEIAEPHSWAPELAGAATTPDAGPAPTADGPGECPPVPTPRSAATVTGSNRTVAAALAQALALRAAAAREAGSGDAEAAVELPTGRAPAHDARDRLLAVLLDDPEHAVDAAEELVACRGQLGEVLGRLAASGLSVDQLARLSGLPIDEVRGLLGRRQRFS